MRYAVIFSLVIYPSYTQIPLVFVFFFFVLFLFVHIICTYYAGLQNVFGQDLLRKTLRSTLRTVSVTCPPPIHFYYACRCVLFLFHLLLFFKFFFLLFISKYIILLLFFYFDQYLIIIISICSLELDTSIGWEISVCVHSS